MLPRARGLAVGRASHMATICSNSIALACGINLLVAGLATERLASATLTIGKVSAGSQAVDYILVRKLPYIFGPHTYPS